MKLYSVALVTLACLLCACSTELKSVRIVKPGDTPVAGAPYNLAYTRFKVTVIRRVASCVDKNGAPAITVKVQATAVPEQHRDPLRNYVLDMASLQGAFKSSDIQVAYYDSGAIKSINGSAEDKTGEVLASVAQSAVKLAGVSAMVPGILGLDGGSAPRVKGCSKNVETALRNLPAEEEKLTAGTARINQKIDELKQYLSVAVVMGRTLPQADRDRLTQVTRDLIAFQKANLATQARIDQLLDTLSVTDEVNWPDNGETFVSTLPVLDAVSDAVLAKWVDGGILGNKVVKDETRVYLHMASGEAIGRTAPCTANCADETVNGLKYRMPALGTLSMCAKLTVVADQPPTCRDGKVDVAKDIMISQLGPIFTLPLKSALFTNKAIVATFSETGVPTSLGTTSGAAAEKAAAMLGSLTDTAVAAHASRAGREAAELEGKIKVLTLRKELEAATLALVPTPKDAKKDATDIFTVDTALLNAELANLAAKAALDEARQRTPAT